MTARQPAMKTTALQSMTDAVSMNSIDSSLTYDDTESCNKEMGKSITSWQVRGDLDYVRNWENELVTRDVETEVDQNKTSRQDQDEAQTAQQERLH